MAAWENQQSVRLVFIYGPPAVGKLSVARELSKQTGFKLYHNHVSIDFVKSIFQFGTPTFWRLVDKYRREMLEEASRQGVDTIFTFVYSKGADDKFVKDIIRRVESHNGKVVFVRLHCRREELIRRVRVRGRRKQGKLATKTGLIGLFKQHELQSEIPFAKSLTVDKTNNPPRKSAGMIARHYKL